MGLPNKFLDYLEVEKKYSPNTIISYRKDLEDFLKFILATEGHEDTLIVDKKVVRNFVVELNKSGLSKRSINRKLSSIRSYYHFLLKIGELKKSPVETIDSLKFYAEKQIPFSEEEMMRFQLLEDSENIDPLVKTIVETLYQTGMRRAELCNLQLKNVDFGSKFLKVMGKGNKERQIPFSNSLEEIFKNYLKIRNPEPSAVGYFFVNSKGKKLNEKFVYSKVNLYLSLVSSKRKISPHILRHSFATHLLDNGADISVVKEILGHASLASTQVYTNANLAQLKKVMNQSHPRAIKKDHK